MFKKYTVFTKNTEENGHVTITIQTSNASPKSNDIADAIRRAFEEWPQYYDKNKNPIDGLEIQQLESHTTSKNTVPVPVGQFKG